MKRLFTLLLVLSMLTAAAGIEAAAATPPGTVPAEAEDEDYVLIVRELPLNSSQQYEANIFLSNFSEQFFGDYRESDADLIQKVVDFAHIYTKINVPKNITYANYHANSYEVMTLAQVNDVVSRFFPYRITARGADIYYPATIYSFFQDDEFYFMAADGEAYNRFTVVDGKYLLSDDTYLLEFTVYEMDLDTYFDEGFSRKYYEMTPRQAAGASELTEVCTGTAVVIPYDYNGRDTYRLLTYSTW